MKIRTKLTALLVIASLCVANAVPVYAAAGYETASPAAVAKAQQNLALIINPAMTTAQKVTAVNDFMVNDMSYDYTYTSYTPDAAILNHKGVCAGYSEAFHLYMQLLGIPSKIVNNIAGNTGRDHAWNQIVVDGVVYEVDVTHNDGSGEAHKYLLLTPEQMAKEHGFVATGEGSSDVETIENGISDAEIQQLIDSGVDVEVIDIYE